jgi:hypothetical protein
MLDCITVVLKGRRDCHHQQMTLGARYVYLSVLKLPSSDVLCAFRKHAKRTGTGGVLANRK